MLGWIFGLVLHLGELEIWFDAVGIKICLGRAGMAFWLVVDLVLLKI